MNKLFLIFLVLFLSACYQAHKNTKDDKNNDNLSCHEIYKKYHSTQPLSFPRKVYINPSNLTEEQVDTAVKSMIFYNSWFRYEIFEPVISNRKIDFNQCGSIYMYGEEIEGSPVGLTTWNKCAATIAIESTWDNDTLFLHELGHSINLKHENDMMSIMYESFSDEIEQNLSDLSKCLINIMIFEAEEIKNKSLSPAVDKTFSFDLKTEVCYHGSQH